MSERVFLDASVLVRYLSADDPPRAFAAAKLIDGERAVVVSGVVLVETMPALRTSLGQSNPELARALIRFITRENVDLVDADKAHLVAALEWSLAAPARRIRDAIVAATAEQAGCDWIATFDDAFGSPINRSAGARMSLAAQSAPSGGARRIDSNICLSSAGSWAVASVVTVVTLARHSILGTIRCWSCYWL